MLRVVLLYLVPFRAAFSAITETSRRMLRLRAINTRLKRENAKKCFATITEFKQYCVAKKYKISVA